MNEHDPQNLKQNQDLQNQDLQSQERQSQERQNQEHKEQKMSAVNCPDPKLWLDLLDPRRQSASMTGESVEDAALFAHLDNCDACQHAADDVRRYQTLLLRGKAPGLTAEQRQSLDARIGLLAGQWQRPPRISPRVTWGIALLAAAVLVFVATRPFVERSHQNQLEFQQRVLEATAPSVDNPGPGVVTSLVEGDVQVAGQDGHWRKLTGGDTIRFGHRLRNPANQANRARVVVPGRFELRLAPDTEVDVLAMADRDAFLRLRHGEVECQVDKLKAGQRYGVMFAGFRASVVGTRFTIRHDDNDSGVVLQVTEGAVRVDQADDPYALPGDTLTMVRAGQRWQYAGGRMALEPIPAPLVGKAPVQQPATTPPVVPEPPAVAPEVPQAAVEAVNPVSAGTPVATRPRATEKAAAPTNAGPTYAFPAATALQPHAIVIEVPPQQMPPPEQLPVHAPAGQNGSGTIER